MKKIKYIIALLLVASIAILYINIGVTSFKLVLGVSIIALLLFFLLAHFYKKRKPETDSFPKKENIHNRLVVECDTKGNYTVGNMIFKSKEHSFYKGDDRKKISHQMTQILLLFFVSADFLVLRKELIQLWDPSYNNDVKLNTGILRLREKLEEIKCPFEIATERNIGYRLIYKEIIEDEPIVKSTYEKPTKKKETKKELIA